MSSTWVIGDVHGCLETLEALLRRLEIDPRRDRVAFVGDLVNRGPSSLGVLRRVRGLAEQMDERFACVLGNHDLHLLGQALGEPARDGDTFDEVLSAPDAASLVSWLRARPLAALVGNALVVHAALDPDWSVAEALSRAAELGALLGGPEARQLLARGKADALPAVLRRAREQLSWFTRVRTCREDGRPCEGFSGAPEQAPAGCLPWYELPHRGTGDVVVAFGHWAALGRRVLHDGRVVALDSGCAWGGELSAYRLEDGTVVAEALRDEVG